MRLLPIAACVAAAVACLAALAPEPAHAGQRCWQAPGDAQRRTTIVATPQVRVYRRGGEDEGTYWACARRSGRTWRLGEEGVSDGLSGFRAAGRYVAFHEWYVNRCCSDSHVTVRVVDAVRRQPLHRWIYSLYGFEGVGDAQLDLRGQRLTARGSYAFMIGAYNARGGGDDVSTQPSYDVVVASRRDGTVVDSGADIDPGSFSATDDVVRWRRAGERRSAPMP